MAGEVSVGGLMVEVGLGILEKFAVARFSEGGGLDQFFYHLGGFLRGSRISLFNFVETCP